MSYAGGKLLFFFFKTQIEPKTLLPSKSINMKSKTAQPEKVSLPLEARVSFDQTFIKG
jgi:hypothetical protein